MQIGNCWKLKHIVNELYRIDFIFQSQFKTKTKHDMICAIKIENVQVNLLKPHSSMLNWYSRSLKRVSF